MKKRLLLALVTILAVGFVTATPARAESCDVYALTVGARNPSSTSVIYSADAKCASGVKGMRFSVNGTVIYEKENTSHIGYWYKPADTDRLCFEAKGSDGVYSASRCVRGNERSSVTGGAVLGTTTTTTSNTTSSRVQNTTCPSTVAPRLANGKTGKTLTSVNVRAAAGITSLRIGRLAPGTSFEVQSEPTCNGGINWWKVKIQEFTGVMAESQFGAYLLSP